MNFCLNVSCNVEKILLQKVNRKMENSSATVCYLDSKEEEMMYQDALNQVLQADPRARAGGNIRIGEIILIVDSDTRVVNHMASMSISS